MSEVVIPLTAVVALHAGSFEMGLLRSLPLAPFIFLALPVGVLVDRRRRRTLLILSDLTRAAVLVSLPVAWLLHRVTIAQLIIVVGLMGCGTVVFEIAYRSYLPTVLDRDRLLEGNNRLELSRSAGRIVAPGVAGWFVQAIGGPLTAVFDVVSYLFSAFMTFCIRTVEPHVVSASAGVGTQIGSGFRTVLGDRRQRALLFNSTMFNFFLLIGSAMSLLYIVTELHLSAAVVGLALSLGAPGALVGSVAVRPMALRLGTGWALVAGTGLAGFSTLLVPLAYGPTLLLVAFVAGGSFLLGFGNQVYNVNLISLQQAITPGEKLGRMNATYRFVAWGVAPIGAFIGGVLGSTVGLRSTLVIAAFGTSLAVIWLLASPVPGLRGRETQAEEAT
jgi:MFS family permease